MKKKKIVDPLQQFINFHKAYHYVLMPLQIIGQLVALILGGGVMLTGNLTLDLIIIYESITPIVKLVLIIVAFIGFFKMKKYAVKCVIAMWIYSMIFVVVEYIVCFVYSIDPGSPASATGTFIWGIAVIAFYVRNMHYFQGIKLNDLKASELDYCAPVVENSGSTYMSPAVVKDIVICPECGSENPNGSAYCTNCGHRISGQN